MMQIYIRKGTDRLLIVLEFLYERVLALVAALAMLLMMLVTLVDVVGRNLFSHPLPGGFEITEFLLAALIFLGLPMVTAADEHVKVDLLDSVIPGSLKTIQNFIIGIINIGAFSVLSWMLWKLGVRSYEYQDTTAMLEIPFAGLVFLMAACSTLSTVALIMMLLIRGGNKLFETSEVTE